MPQIQSNASNEPVILDQNIDLFYCLKVMPQIQSNASNEPVIF